MKNSCLLILLTIMLMGCGKKMGPISPDIWPPNIVSAKIYKDHFNFRFNEPIITDRESIVLMTNNGDTIPILDTINNSQDYSISVFLDSPYIYDSIFVIVNGVMDSSMNEMKQYEKLFTFKAVEEAGTLNVSDIVFEKIRHGKYYINVNFNMPVKKENLSIFAYPTLYTDSCITFLNPHRISIVVSDTPDFILIPDNIYSISGEEMVYPYLKVYAKQSFDKVKLNVKLESAKDSAINYIVFLYDNAVDIVPMNKSIVLDSILSDTCDIFVVSKCSSGIYWNKEKLKGDSTVVFKRFINDDADLLWRDIVDKLSK